MENSEELLAQFKKRYSKKLDLSLKRMERLLDSLDNPQIRLPRVVHITGSNGKESVLAYMRAILYASGKRVHSYVSRHLCSYNERIRLAERTGSAPVSEEVLFEMLSRVKEANGRRALTFFEATTAAALLAFSEAPADYLLIGSGQGGGLDPTNAVEHKDLTVITPVSIDKAPILGETFAEIALEYSGVMRAGVPCIVGPQSPDAGIVIDNYAEQIGADIHASGQDWMVFEQHGRLVYQDDEALIDLPLPRAVGPNQISSAGLAIAAVRKLKALNLSEEDIDAGLQSAVLPAQLQPLGNGRLHQHIYEGSEIWLDSGSRHDDALTLAQAMADFEERVSCPLHIICAMESDQDAHRFLSPFEGLVEFVATIEIPGANGFYSATELAAVARDAYLNAAPQAGLEEALQTCRSVSGGPIRVLICGSHRLAGYVLSEYPAR